MILWCNDFRYKIKLSGLVIYYFIFNGNINNNTFVMDKYFINKHP